MDPRAGARLGLIAVVLPLCVALAACGGKVDGDRPPSCSDGKRNGAEADVDCGGPCRACASGLSCGVAADCQSGVCSGTCQAPTCSDGVKNAAETDVDCGGGGCPACADGLVCTAAADCRSGVCNGTCQAATCGDGVKNGAESDVDCGGGTCSPCAVGAACQVAGDCQSYTCSTTCQPLASCANGVQDGLESDVDCGGPLCAPCAAGAACTHAFDCASLLCSGLHCQDLAATCADGMKNGTETAVDCGGLACGACADGSTCNAGADCRSGTCGATSGCCRDWAILSWWAPQADTDGNCVNSLAGFKVYLGTTSGTYIQSLDLPLGSTVLSCADSGVPGQCHDWIACTATITFPSAGLWYIATTAYTRALVESGYSNEVSKNVVPCP